MIFLLVDDSKFARTWLKNSLMIEYKDVLYEECGDGQSAIREYDIVRPDIVFLDYTLPDMNGVEVAKKIYELDEDVKIIMITAMGSNYIKDEALMNGVRYYLLKPYKPKEILEKVRALIE